MSNELRYRRHLRATIASAVASAGGPAAVGGRCGMLAHDVSSLGAAHLPSIRVLLRVAGACGTTPGAMLAKAERAMAEEDEWLAEFSVFGGWTAACDGV